MKEITLSADDDLIERARSIAREQRRTLDEAFQDWLTEFTTAAGEALPYDSRMGRRQSANGDKRPPEDEAKNI